MRRRGRERRIALLHKHLPPDVVRLLLAGGIDRVTKYAGRRRPIRERTTDA